MTSRTNRRIAIIAVIGGLALAALVAVVWLAVGAALKSPRRGPAELQRRARTSEELRRIGQAMDQYVKSHDPFPDVEPLSGTTRPSEAAAQSQPTTWPVAMEGTP